MRQEHRIMGTDGKQCKTPRDGTSVMVETTWATFKRQWNCGRAELMRSLWPGWDSSGFDREAQNGVLLQDLHSLSSPCTNCWWWDWVIELLNLGFELQFKFERGSSAMVTRNPDSFSIPPFALIASLLRGSTQGFISVVKSVLSSIIHSFTHFLGNHTCPKSSGWYIKLPFPYL